MTRRCINHAKLTCADELQTQNPRQHREIVFQCLLARCRMVHLSTHCSRWCSHRHRSLSNTWEDSVAQVTVVGHRHSKYTTTASRQSDEHGSVAEGTYPWPRVSSGRCCQICSQKLKLGLSSLRIRATPHVRRIGDLKKAGDTLTDFTRRDMR